MNHEPECRWAQTTETECAYKATHHYCPHPEHACTCADPSANALAEARRIAKVVAEKLCDEQGDANVQSALLAADPDALPKSLVNLIAPLIARALTPQPAAQVAEVQKAIADTREADAKKCDAISLKAILSGDRDRGAGAIECAAAIRAQPETVEVSLQRET